MDEQTKEAIYDEQIASLLTEMIEEYQGYFSRVIFKWQPQESTKRVKWVGWGLTPPGDQSPDPAEPDLKPM